MYTHSYSYETDREGSEPDFGDNKVSNGGLEWKVNNEDSRGENEAINDPAFVYVPVIEGGKGYHVLDLAKTIERNPRWKEKKIRQIMKARKIETKRVFPDFNYENYAAKKAVQLQNKPV